MQLPVILEILVAMQLILEMESVAAQLELEKLQLNVLVEPLKMQLLAMKEILAIPPKIITMD